MLSLKNYSQTALYRIVKEAQKDFKHIIIDLPADLREQVVTYTFSRHFHYIDNIVVVLDEDALTFKRLHDFSAILNLGHEDAKEVTYIVNKTTQYYVDFIDKSLDLPKLKPINLLKIEDFNEMSDRTNRGNLYSLTGGRKYKKFFKEIDKLVDICLNNKDGYGIRPIYVSEASKERRLGSKYVPPKEPKIKKPLFKNKKKFNKDNENETNTNEFSNDVQFNQNDLVAGNEVDNLFETLDSLPQEDFELEQAQTLQQEQLQLNTPIQPSNISVDNLSDSVDMKNDLSVSNVIDLNEDISSSKQNMQSSTISNKGAFKSKFKKGNLFSKNKPVQDSTTIDLNNLEPIREEVKESE